MAPVQTVVATLAFSSSFRWIESQEQAYASLPQFLAALGQLPQLYSIHAGFDDASWIQLAALDNVPRRGAPGGPCRPLADAGAVY